jgi:prepilin-type N-terminal cleavage/methylation domain-containing protein
MICNTFHKQHGFSMIEMLVVLAIMIMIMGVSVSTVGNFGRFKASTDLGEFNSFLRKGFMDSVRTGQYYRLAIDMVSGEYWLESSETPFFIGRGEKHIEKIKEAEETVERMESFEKSDIFKRESGQAIGVDNFFQRAQLLSDGGIDADEYFHYENFIPDRRSIRDILKPSFSNASETKKFDENLTVTSFFAYHTPEIITPDHIVDKKNDKMVYVYIFPQGRIEPFYLGLGEPDEFGYKTFSHLSSDIFMNSKIDAGEFGDEVRIIQDVLDDQDAQGR